jgi:predicted nucleic acid-binding protein
MSLYLETSCLLKLVLDEPDSPKVEAALSGETDITVSALTRLEAASVLQAMLLGGELSKREHAIAGKALAQMIAHPPFRLSRVPADACELAQKQIEAGSPYCRTLDRLHLAVAIGLGLRRFMTGDQGQAKTAHALGLEVIVV